MIHKLVSAERFTFTCRACEHAWSLDYGVRHVEDGHGHEHDYYLRDGLPVVNPAAHGAVVCPRCGRDRVDARPRPQHAATIPD